jgi:2-polyprenyl-3-methyl-5-hydroxy-6-metoxy-1,4-benzoquinol methylase
VIVDPTSVSDAITPDGCSVELYARVPPLGEAEVLHHRLADGAAVLDLGCGTGRIARRLARLGHPVVAVDESGAMLAQMPMTPGVRPVQGTIQDLRLDERFAAVLLASNLINTMGVGLRRG